MTTRIITISVLGLFLAHAVTGADTTSRQPAATPIPAPK